MPKADRKGKGKANKPVGGNGIFVTCVRGKELRCKDEFLDLLDVTADRIYSPERIAQLEKLRATSHLDGEEDTQDQSEDEDDDNDDETDQEMADDSIEASIAKELAELKQAGKRGKGKIQQKKDSKGRNAGEKKARFQSIDTGTECLLFVRVRWPYDPFELVEAIVTETAQTGNSQTRYTQRLSPTAISCPSNQIDRVQAESAALIERMLFEWAQSRNVTQVTYSIDPSVRSHTHPLDRAVLIELLGSAVRALSQPTPTRSAVLNVSANLGAPDLVLLPIVLKNAYSLGIVRGELWSGVLGKKFNIDGIATEARRRISAAEGPTAVRGMEIESEQISVDAEKFT